MVAEVSMTESGYFTCKCWGLSCPTCPAMLRKARDMGCKVLHLIGHSVSGREHSGAGVTVSSSNRQWGLQMPRPKEMEAAPVGML